MWPELAEASLHLARRHAANITLVHPPKPHKAVSLRWRETRDGADRRKLKANLENEMGYALYYSDRYPDARFTTNRPGGFTRISRITRAKPTRFRRWATCTVCWMSTRRHRRLQEALPIYHEIEPAWAKPTQFRRWATCTVCWTSTRWPGHATKKPCRSTRRSKPAWAKPTDKGVGRRAPCWPSTRCAQRYEEALPIYQEIDARLGEANTIKALGDVHHAG